MSVVAITVTVTRSALAAAAADSPNNDRQEASHRRAETVA